MAVTVHCFELLLGYREGRLGPQARHEVQRHLSVCPECREALSETARIVDSLDGVLAALGPLSKPQARQWHAIWNRAARPARPARPAWPVSMAGSVVMICFLLWVNTLPVQARSGLSFPSQPVLLNMPPPATENGATVIAHQTASAGLSPLAGAELTTPVPDPIPAAATSPAR